MRIKSSLLDNIDGELVTIQGRMICTEEAALTWQSMTTAERSKYLGMTDIAIVESIYAEFFDYFKVLS